MVNAIHELLKPNTVVQAILLLVAIAGMFFAFWPDARKDRRIGYAMFYAGTSLFLGKCFWPIPNSFRSAAQAFW